MDTHCMFCDSPCEPSPYGHPFCDRDENECGPDFAFVLTDDAGNGWTVRVSDESQDRSGLVFLSVRLNGKPITNSGFYVYIENADVSLSHWNLYTKCETLHEALTGEMQSLETEEDVKKYHAAFDEMREMFARIGRVLRAECEERGLWNSVVVGYARAQQQNHEDDVRDFEYRVQEFICSERGNLTGDEIRNAIEKVLRSL